MLSWVLLLLASVDAQRTTVRASKDAGTPADAPTIAYIDCKSDSKSHGDLRPPSMRHEQVTDWLSSWTETEREGDYGTHHVDLLQQSFIGAPKPATQSYIGELGGPKA